MDLQPDAPSAASAPPLVLLGLEPLRAALEYARMGVLLGIAGASFGVALSLGSGWFPPQHKGLAMGLVGAGNVGTAVSVLVPPPPSPSR